MKKITFTIGILYTSFYLFAQAPQSINYQAVARDASGNLLNNQTLTVRFSVHDGSALGAVDFQETHAVTTNDYGLFSVHIGEGTTTSGSFAAIPWGTSACFLQVEIDNGGGFLDMGTTQLLSVPYAIYANEAGNVTVYTAGTGISISGNAISNTGDTDASDDITNSTTAGGDLSGTYPNPTVDAIQGRNVAGTAPANGQVLKWNASVWAPASDDNTTYSAGTGLNLSGTTFSNTAPDQTVAITGSGATTVSGTYPNFTVSSTDNNTTYSAGTGLSLSGTTFNNTGDTNASDDITNSTTAGGDLSGTYPNPGVGALQGRAVSGTAPLSGQVLKWNGTTWTPATDSSSDNDWQVSGNTVFVDSSKTVESGSGSQPMVSVHGGHLNFRNTGNSVFIGMGAGSNDDLSTNSNIFVGNLCGNANTTGYSNIAIGNQALKSNTTRSNLVAIGDSALFNNGSGATLYYHASGNSAIGSKALYNNTTGFYNTASGFQALYANTTGYYNTANGYQALYANTSGYGNTANGYRALYANTTGNKNTASGYYALYSNTTGYGNVANGWQTLYANTTGYGNSANGMYALNANTTGNRNVANGMYALNANTTGNRNVANGNEALMVNTTGYNNTANGFQALNRNTTGYNNTANGMYALMVNTTGFYNTANGYQALYNNTTGYGNTANGYRALYANTTGNKNTASGYYALSSNTTGSSNTALGDFAYFITNNLNNTTCIGYLSGAISNVSNRIEIGNTSVSWIGGQVTWSTYSDQRIKRNIKENVPGLDFITRLRPVTYNLDIHKMNEMIKEGEKGKEESNWEGKYDIENKQMTGFIAQEVEQAAQEVNYNFSGVKKAKDDLGMYSVSYAQFVVPLVKAVQEQQEMIKTLNEKEDKKDKLIYSQEERINELEQKIDILMKAVKIN